MLGKREGTERKEKKGERIGGGGLGAACACLTPPALLGSSSPPPEGVARAFPASGCGHPSRGGERWPPGNPRESEQMPVLHR